MPRNSRREIAARRAMSQEQENLNMFEDVESYMAQDARNETWDCLREQIGAEQLGRIAKRSIDQFRRNRENGSNPFSGITFGRDVVQAMMTIPVEELGGEEPTMFVPDRQEPQTLRAKQGPRGLQDSRVVQEEAAAEPEEEPEEELEEDPEEEPEENVQEPERPEAVGFLAMAFETIVRSIKDLFRLN